MSSYDRIFFENQKDGSERSAEILLPIIIDHITPNSVIDFGCGVGTWLSVASKLRIPNILGLDGSWVSEEQLQIPNQFFKAVDLEKIIVEIPKKYDLSISMEVLEHLSERAALNVLDVMTECSDHVLLSAAVPQQGGCNHINEQPQSYWIKQMRNRGFIAKDILRQAIWNNSNVDVWYRQNSMFFTRKGTQIHLPDFDTAMADVIHPDLYQKQVLDYQKQVLGYQSSIEKEKNKRLVRRFRRMIGLLK